MEKAISPLLSLIVGYVGYQIGLRRGKSQLSLEKRFALAIEAIEEAEKKFPGQGQGKLKFPWAVAYYRERTGANEEQAKTSITEAFLHTLFSHS